MVNVKPQAERTNFMRLYIVPTSSLLKRLFALILFLYALGLAANSILKVSNGERFDSPLMQSETNE